MNRTEESGNGARFPAAILAGAVLLGGCADLALEADRIPAELVINPGRALLGTGEMVELDLRAKDEDGEFMQVPNWIAPEWHVSDESVVERSPDGTLTATGAGRAVVTARLGRLEAKACFHVDADPLRLTAPVIYLTQAAQNRHNTIALIAGRTAFARIFVVADRANSLALSARVALLQDGDVLFEVTTPAGTDGIPTEVDESDLNGSINLEIPGEGVQPGAGLAVELDPECMVPATPGSTILFPAEAPKRLDVVEPPLFRLILVPTLSRPAPDSAVFEWTDGVNPYSEQMRLGRTLLPVGDMEVEVHETYTTSLDLRNFGTWRLWRNEIGVLYEQEGRRGYYYGVVSRNLLGVAGTANIGYPVSVGADADDVFTHEVGHTMNLYHAPCGGASGPDPYYPHENGSIGVWGYDIWEGRLLDPGLYRDVMSYCFQHIWISDYQFDRALTHRLDGDGGINHDAGAAAFVDSDQGEVLVVWGGVWDGRPKLDAAFVIRGPAALPESDGPHRVEGLGEDGETRFSLSFSPIPLDHGGSSFVHLLPWDPAWAGNLDRMVLTGPEGEYTVTRDGEPEIAVVTDPSTGRIRAIIRDWDGGPLPHEETADVTVTRGIPAGGLR